jgi:hypothetical protein
MKLFDMRYQVLGVAQIEAETAELAEDRLREIIDHSLCPTSEDRIEITACVEVVE